MRLGTHHNNSLSNYHVSVRAGLTSVFEIVSPARVLPELVEVVLAEHVGVEEVGLAVALAGVPSRPGKKYRD